MLTSTMNRFIFIILLSFSNLLLAQDSDYIVRKGNDTTYCKIKRISKDKIFFIYKGEQKLYNELSDVLGYKNGDEEFVIVQIRNDSSAISKNTVFIEFLGTGFLGSLNYDRRLINKPRFNVSGRLGASYFPRGTLDPLWSVPIEVKFLLNIGKEYYVELGAGLSYIFGIVSCVGCGSKDNESSSTLFSSIRTGIRYQKKSGGIFMNAGFTPLIRIREYNKNPPEEITDEIERLKILPHIGVGIGYTIKTKK